MNLDISLDSISTATSSPRAIHSNIAKETFFMKELPDLCVANSSAEGKRLFTSALTHGFLENYFLLIEKYRTQDDPAYCGPASLSMILNTL